MRLLSGSRTQVVINPPVSASSWVLPRTAKDGNAFGFQLRDRVIRIEHGKGQDNLGIVTIIGSCLNRVDAVFQPWFFLTNSIQGD